MCYNYRTTTKEEKNMMLTLYHGEKYDLVYGPVANDDVYRTITLYMTGILSKTQTLEALKIRKLYNQLVFKSEKSLEYIKFQRRIFI